MELRKCPVCGGKLRSEALGWICYDCKGFIDMQGVFHEHKEKPFMPPMTNADRIRAMTDEELEPTILAFKLGYAPWCDHHCKNEGEYGCDTCILNWLKQPSE